MQSAPYAAVMAQRVCPVWVGYFLASPIRKWFQSPERLLSPFMHPGATVLEVGPGMGFFTIPIAKMLAGSGRVVAVDVQPRMLDELHKRARAAGVSDRIETRICTPTSLCVANLLQSVDFILLFAVVHEVPQPLLLFQELAVAAKPGAQVLLAEPRGHVSEAAFAETLNLAAQCGFQKVGSPAIRGSLTAVLRREGTSQGL